MATWCAASAVLMELSRYLKRTEIKAEVKWIPENDKEADAPWSLRPVSTQPAVFTWCPEIEWEILHEAPSMGMAAEED